MNLEDRLKGHFAAREQVVPSPPDNLDHIVRRGRRRQVITRATAAAAVVAVLVAAPVIYANLQRTTVEFDVANPGISEHQSEPSAPASEPEPAPSNVLPGPSDVVPSEAEPSSGPSAARAVGLADLGAPVLAYGPYEHDQLHLVDGNIESGVDNVAGPVDVALPDGRGGVVWQVSSTQSIGWSQSVRGAGKAPVILAEANAGPQGREEEIHLRGMLPDGRALYSIRPAKSVREGDLERFYAVELFTGAEPELVGEVGAYESWTVGPARTIGGGQVHASCHLHCSLWTGPFGEPDGAQRLYEGLSIEGLSSTPDWAYFAFVEYDAVLGTEGRDPELVIFDGRSLDEIARVRMPLPEGHEVGFPTVSLRKRYFDVIDAVVSFGRAGVTISPPTTPFLVRDILQPNPKVRPVDFAGAVIWMHPLPD